MHVPIDATDIHTYVYGMYKYVRVSMNLSIFMYVNQRNNVE